MIRVTRLAASFPDAHALECESLGTRLVTTMETLPECQETWDCQPSLFSALV